jgi:hypothetical protein
MVPRKATTKIKSGLGLDHLCQDKAAAGQAPSRRHRRFIIIPGLDPGIPTDSAGWGDPRITSGDDDETFCLARHLYSGGYAAGPRITSGHGHDKFDSGCLPSLSP